MFLRCQKLCWAEKFVWAVTAFYPQGIAARRNFLALNETSNSGEVKSSAGGRHKLGDPVCSVLGILVLRARGPSRKYMNQKGKGHTEVTRLQIDNLCHRPYDSVSSLKERAFPPNQSVLLRDSAVRCCGSMKGAEVCPNGWVTF